jgi:hypothetical protein
VSRLCPGQERELEDALAEAERQVRELEGKVWDQHALVARLAAERRIDAVARERLFRLTEMLKTARQRVADLKAWAD